MFAFQDKRSAVEVFFTDRFGGTSPGPYAELTLTVPTDPGALEQCDARTWQETVEDNWERVTSAVLRGGPPPEGGRSDVPAGDRAAVRPGVRRPVTMRQVHGAEVLVVEDQQPGDDCEADALVTATAGVVLAARAADCVPVLLADPDRGVVGAVHAGRRGVLLGVVPNAVAALRRLGAEHVVAWVGPAACGRCYEVPADLREEVAEVVPETWSETSWGTPALDLPAGVRAQLRASGAEEVIDLERCTIEDTDFFSHRRQAGRAGRQAALVWVRP